MIIPRLTIEEVRARMGGRARRGDDRGATLRPTILLLALLVVLMRVPPAGSQQSAWERDFSLTVEQEERLTPANVSALRSLLTAIPRSLISGLRTISLLDDLQMFDFQDQNRINCFPGDGFLPFPLWPSDLPGTAPRPSGFYGVCSHELGHQLPVSAVVHRPGFVAWATELIAEAGCDPSHYLPNRPESVFGPCFFHRFPQEFVAAIAEQWFVDSQAMWRLAIKRFRDGDPHPANQAVLITAWFGALPIGMTHEVVFIPAFRYERGVATAQMWSIHPWRCGGLVTVAGTTFSFTLDLDARCRVVVVLDAGGV